MGVSEEWGVLCNQAISACAGLEIHPTHGTAHPRHCTHTHTQVPSLPYLTACFLHQSEALAYTQ